MNTLLFQKHSKSANLCETIYNVYKAKRNAEVMEGVGKETEVLILREEGVEKLSNEKLNILQSIYESELKYGKNHSDLSGLSLNDKKEVSENAN